MKKFILVILFLISIFLITIGLHTWGAVLGMITGEMYHRIGK